MPPQFWVFVWYPRFPLADRSNRRATFTGEPKQDREIAYAVFWPNHWSDKTLTYRPDGVYEK
jgi:hypothetical protein